MSEQPGENVEIPEGDVMDALGGVTDGTPEMEGAEPRDGGSGGGVLSDNPDAGAPSPESTAPGGMERVLEIATRSPSKSLHDINESDYFDPENGGTKRLLLVFDDAVTEGEGLQNWMHVLVALAELSVGDGLDVLAGESDGGESDESGTQSNTETTLEETPDGGYDIA